MGSFGKDRRRRMERFLKHVSVLQAVMPAIAEENEPELSFSEGSISAIDVLFSDHPKCLHLIFIYLSGLMISIGNLRLLKYASVEE
jgi:hypothetical protein